MENFIITSIHSFINTVEISFDYINDEYIKNFNKHVNNIEQKQLFKEIFDNLHVYHHQIIDITNYKGKLKKIDFTFMDSIILFKLKFNVFTNENKATKKNLISHLYNFYYPIFLQEMGDPIVREAFEKSVIKTPQIQLKTPQIQLIPQIQRKNVDPLESLLGNKEIMKMANDIQEQISRENIDPMSMLTSLMSGGDGGDAFKSIVSNVTKNVDSKLNSGELNKDDLENQAKNVIGNLGIDTSKELDANSISNLFSNLMGSSQKK